MIPAPGQRARVIQVSPLMREMVFGALGWPLKEQQEATGE
jgi:hypothetical protein